MSNLFPILNKSRATAEAVSRLLLETDAPVQYQELASRPVHVQVTLKEVARVKGVSVEEIAARMSEEDIRAVSAFLQGLR